MLQIVDRLEIQPVLGGGIESPAEADRHLRRDGTFSVHDPGDCIVRDMDTLGEFPRAETESLQFISQDAPWMDGCKLVDRLGHFERQ